MTGEFFLKVVVASLATVGIMEFIKNFFQPANKLFYALVMLPLAVVCFVAAYMLPEWIIGSLLTVGCVQLCYQTLVQGFKAIVSSMTRNLNANDNGTDSAQSQGEK